jgi:hypothetical protein
VPLGSIIRRICAAFFSRDIRNNDRKRVLLPPGASLALKNWIRSALSSTIRASDLILEFDVKKCSPTGLHFSRSHSLKPDLRPKSARFPASFENSHFDFLVTFQRSSEVFPGIIEISRNFVNFREFLRIFCKRRKSSVNVTKFYPILRSSKIG